MSFTDLNRVKNVPTWQDLLDAILLTFDLAGKANHIAWGKMAARTAVRTFSGLRQWSYYLRNAAVETVAEFTDGEISYDAASNVVTLTGAVWPADMTYRRIWVNNMTLFVRDILSTTTLSLKDPPAEDIALGGYRALLAEYPVPATARRLTELKPCNGVNWTQYVSPQEAMQIRNWNQVDASSAQYTIRADSRRSGGMVFEFSPMPTTVKRYEYLYFAAPGDANPKVYSKGYNYTAGKATWVDGGTEITGSSGALFTDAMVGQVIRLGNAAVPPTGELGEDPFAHQRIVTAVTDTTHLEVDTPIDGAGTGLGMTIADPLDVPPELWDVVVRLAVWEFAKVTKGGQDLDQWERLYRDSLGRAFAADQAWSPDNIGSWAWLPLEFSPNVRNS